ncbi:unnamed protein product [Penicillium salamii]|uniref:Uncharacterized protein n=1 Tax=Penicillium salamii TaxID=1612424 RepID=A0A9W4J868_9EURO|nr:unnamed protein product [Penicillium salamii]CAG7985981.1 unnamed protein product [Penicillium salamii]CAG8167414.1 unnamed protein product [Penicillium salamii]CAG8233767.1 unnamed protein product [Penicillium salamii]CAG8244559.1 unnamed protein product [Penicillium salamii]
MAGSNPFRARNLGTPDSGLPPSNIAPVLSKSQFTPPAATNGYVKSSISLEREVDDSSSDQDTNPFHPNVSASDSDEDNRPSHWTASDDRPASFGPAPHQAPSPDESSTSSVSPDRSMRSIRGAAPDASPDTFQHAILETEQPSPRLETSASPPNRRDRKPPPPPKSHHGRRISSTSTEPAQADRSRSTNRLSIHGFPSSVTPGASHPSTVSLPSTADYLSASTDDQRATEATGSLTRSHSQNKRPPTPPLSRRRSQMQRSKSTQSKHNRLTMSSYDSDSNHSSRPSSPGPSTRSLAHKRISMPPPSSGGFQPMTPLADVSLNVSPPTTSRPASLKAGRRASSYGTSGSAAGSTGPPPPPPPRRTRDSMIRSSDSVPVPKPENQPPSNALDILADLTKLQKELLFFFFVFSLTPSNSPSTNIMTTPTLINLPPPPSDPVTPSDMGPGTPNSGTTSLSALSTTAIKDGHQGHFPHGRHAHHSSTSSATTLEAERADRISRLAGLERVATARAGNQTSGQVPTSYAPGYFESQPLKERSTVGSASATGSLGGRTTWASSSDVYDADKMSEDHDDETDSVGNISESNASLVGFGEGANSTISGPTSRPPGLNRISSGHGNRPPSMSSNVSRPNALASYLQQQQYHAGERSMVSPSPAGSSTPEPLNEDARMVDGMTFDSGVVDTTARTPRVATPLGSNGFGSPGRD